MHRLRMPLPVLRGKGFTSTERNPPGRSGYPELEGDD